MYERMVLIRVFEETTMRQFADGQIPGFVHLYAGEEAVAVGVCTHLERRRLHHQHPPRPRPLHRQGRRRRPAMAAELMGRQTGICKGKGGSMHVADVEKGMLGANGIVGGGIPLALRRRADGEDPRHRRGRDLLLRRRRRPTRAPSTRALNLAAIWKLPVVFVCENNGYAEATHLRATTARSRTSRPRAQGYDIPGVDRRRARPARHVRGRRRGDRPRPARRRPDA